ncbi:uncharacterized protein LOC114185684 [Vigna unguiculata]|uniref:uncharacterized protein LOC114185684 n=1 Tax=Vigna unguiculata TaxID=3917 RepID=UPI0010166E9E|nr:uncharacterized protein LOC114185684 [Vigna unguiculata]
MRSPLSHHQRPLLEASPATLSPFTPPRACTSVSSFASPARSRQGWADPLHGREVPLARDRRQRLQPSAAPIHLQSSILFFYERERWNVWAKVMIPVGDRMGWASFG